MRILVTGGGGFLGSHICKRLVAAGHEVQSISRHKYAELDELGVKSFQGNLVDREAIRPALQGVEAIIHTAAKAGVYGSYDSFYEINFLGTKNLVDLALEMGIKYFVHTSSPSVVFGRESIEAGDESLPYPDTYLSYYPQTKALAEKYVLSRASEKFKCVAIRPHLIWGKGDPHLIPRIVSKAREGKLRIVGDGQNLVDIIHVDNAALAHELALNALVAGKDIAGRSYFIGQERPVVLWEFINQILLRSGLEPVMDHISEKKAFIAGAVLEKLFAWAGIKKPEPPMTRFVAVQLSKSHYFKHDRAQADFSYRPIVTIEQGLEETFAHRKILATR